MTIDRSPFRFDHQGTKTLAPISETKLHRSHVSEHNSFSPVPFRVWSPRENQSPVSGRVSRAKAAQRVFKGRRTLGW